MSRPIQGANHLFPQSSQPPVGPTRGDGPRQEPAQTLNGPTAQDRKQLEFLARRGSDNAAFFSQSASAVARELGVAPGSFVKDVMQQKLDEGRRQIERNGYIDTGTAIAASTVLLPAIGASVAAGVVANAAVNALPVATRSGKQRLAEAAEGLGLAKAGFARKVGKETDILWISWGMGAALGTALSMTAGKLGAKAIKKVAPTLPKQAVQQASVAAGKAASEAMTDAAVSLARSRAHNNAIRKL